MLVEHVLQVNLAGLYGEYLALDQSLVLVP